MGTNTGIGIGIGIPFKNNALGGDRPYLPPELKARLIGVWDNYGKKNTDADRNIIKNKIPNAGGDLEILNAAYKLNSGFGEYKEDFTSWRIYPNIKVTDNVITTNGNFNSTWFIYKHSSESKINEMNIKVSGIPEGGIIRYFYISDETANLPIVYTIPKDGIYHLPESKINNNRASVGFTVESSYDWNNIRIEQIPSFEGAFVTDGIDDLITSTKTVQEMLGGSNELTIVSMVHQVKDSTNNISFTNYIRGSANGYFRNIVNNYGKTGIYGYTSSDLRSLSVINNILGDKNDYTSNGDNRDTIINGNFSVQGYSYNDGNNTGDFSSVAWYWTIIANKVLTTDQINQVIAYFNLDRTLKSDIYCNIAKQGITNENHAEFGDKLIDFSGNGRDIQLNNLAWDGDSGIGKYNYPNWKVNVTQGNKYARIVYYDSINGTYSADFKGVTELYKSYGLSVEIRVNRANTVDFHSIKEDGIYTITPPDDTTSMDIRFGGENVYNASCDITITQIPSHAGALCLDGVDDFGKVTGMPIYKDYTFIIDRQIISIGDTNGIVASKSEDPTDVNKQGAFLFEYLGNPNNVSAWSFYKDNGKVANTDFTRGISYQSKYSYNGIELLAGTAFDSDKLWLGTLRDKDSRFANVAIYSLISFPYSMSEFLIERQLKKHKLGTLYPDMVEFRPVIKSSVELVNKPTFAIRGTSTLLNAGDYIPENSEIWVVITMNNAADRITKFVINGNTIDIPSSAYNPSTMKYGFPFTIDNKSPQKITMTIEQDENYVQWNPVVTSNVEYVRLDFYLNNYQKRINIGDYIPKDVYLKANLYLKNNVDELTVFTFNGVNIGYRRSSVDDTAFNIGQIYNYDSPQEVNITIDEYIRYEDIVQPYPVIFQITDRNTNQRYSWGDKIKVGSSIQLTQGENPNLLKGLYSIRSYEYEGKTYSYNQLTNLNITVTKQSISLSCNKTWLLDNNEPKVILSPRLLRIPNSSYKILGHIPDISGHGNHGKINNSAYAEGSGVNEDGSYQFDGVDDSVTIPINGGKQVFMKVNWNTSNGAILYDQRNSEEGGNFSDRFAVMTSNSDSILAYSGRNTDGKTYIDGILNANITCGQLLNITHNITALAADNRPLGKRGVVIGASKTPASYCKAAVYDFMLFDEISTDDKIKELNEYVGIEPKVELPPYYWDTYGKTNFDADKATIQQRGVAIGDYDLTNYNHTYEGMSGYNGYPVVFGANKTWANESNEYVTSITSNTIHITNVLNAGLALLYSYVKYNGNLQNIKEIPPFKIEIKGLEGRSKFIYKYLATSDATKETNLYLENGTHELPKSFLPTEALINNAVVGFSISPIEEGVTNFLSDITIKVLPEYENGLVYDGVEDFSDNKNVPLIDDFTVIAKRTWLEENTSDKPFIIKGDTLYPDGNKNAFLFEYGKLSTYSFGQNNKYDESVVPSLISWATPTSYNGTTSLVRGSAIDTVGIDIAHATKIVLYKLILYPKTIPLLQINFLKNLMEKDEIIDLTNPIFIKNE